MSSIRRLSSLALAATLVLVTVGGFTRGSKSGYGCQDRWPLCENGLLGGLLPRGEFHMIVEWTHRWVAAMVGLLALALAVEAWRRHRHEPKILIPATLTVAVIGIQAWVGRMVVKGELASDLVSLHLTISMAILALLTVVATSSSDGLVDASPAQAKPHRSWAHLVTGGALAVLAVLLFGSLVHNLYFSGWPFVGNRLIPNLENPKVALHFTHRVLAGAVFLYLGFLSLRSTNKNRPTIEARLINGATAIYVLNIAIGAGHVVTKVSSSALVAAHLAAASVSWVLIIAAATMAYSGNQLSDTAEVTAEPAI